MDQIVQQAERGRVMTYSARHCFGFITTNAGGRDVFFHKSRLDWIGMSDIAPGTKVGFIRGRDRDGRLQVDRFVEVNGQAVTGTMASKAKAIEVSAAPVALHKSSSVPTPAKAPSVAALAEGWIRVRIRKLRVEHTTYAQSDLGNVLVPWSVLEHTKIRSIQREEQFEVKCRQEKDELVAFEIRRV